LFSKSILVLFHFELYIPDQVVLRLVFTATDRLAGESRDNVNKSRDSDFVFERCADAGPSERKSGDSSASGAQIR
jgi:hypothetical protein